MADLSESEGSVQLESENEDSIQSETEDVVQTEAEEPKRKMIPINNVHGLNAKLKGIELQLDWIEKLDVSINTEEILKDPVASQDNKAENDFNREMSFYNQALSAVSKAFKRLKTMNIPTKRPPDFYAEMAKSDSHMNKVREKLLSKQMIVERREKVREEREKKKHGKKIQIQIQQDRKQEKKKMLNALSKAKKGKIGADALLGEKKESAGKSQKINKKNREFRDSKYGYGGKKRGNKWNTAESSAESKFSKRNSFSKDKKFGRNKPRPKKHRRRR